MYAIAVLLICIFFAINIVATSAISSYATSGPVLVSVVNLDVKPLRATTLTLFSILVAIGLDSWRMANIVRSLLRDFSQYQRPRTFIVGPSGITVREPLSAITYTWAAFSKWKETPDLFILYTSTLGGEIVTKRAVGDPARQEWLRGVLRKYIDAQQLQQPAFPVQDVG